MVGSIAGTVLLAAGAPRVGMALMSGVPPDSPEARVDANSSTSPWSGVGAVTDGGRSYSGALIDRRHVLTAAHVVENVPPARLGFQLNTDGSPRRIGVEAVFQHPDYEDVAPSFPQFDAAIIRLAEDAPAGVPIYPLHDGPIGPRALVTMVGYGGSGRGDEEPSIGARPDVKRVGQNVIDKLIPIPGSETRPGVFVFDFDGPDAFGNTMGGEGLGNELETSAATGDSGAPVFIVRGRYRAIIGILGFVDDLEPGQSRLSRFGGIGGGTLVAPLREWIEEILGASQQARTGETRPSASAVRRGDDPD